MSAKYDKMHRSVFRPLLPPHLKTRLTCAQNCRHGDINARRYTGGRGGGHEKTSELYRVFAFRRACTNKKTPTNIKPLLPPHLKTRLSYVHKITVTVTSTRGGTRGGGARKNKRIIQSVYLSASCYKKKRQRTLNSAFFLKPQP